MATAGKTQRDVRLDFFRGLALWLIFVDHIPGNIVNWFTLRNYGFSDAAELFVFISGYTAAFVYGRTMRDRGFVVAGARILKRAWQIYVAHVFLFVIFVAEIAYLSRGFENPLFAEEMNILEFLQAPHQTLFQAMLLKFKPANMDILPVYIVLLLGFPLAALAAPARADRRACGFDRDLRDFQSSRLEPALLSERRLDHQSLVLAAAVCVRGLVRGLRGRPVALRHPLADRGGGGSGLCGVRLLHRFELVHSAARAPMFRTGLRTSCIRSTRSISTCCGSRISSRWRCW